MLIRKEHLHTGALLGIWKMEESREELLALFPGTLRSEALGYVESIRSERRSIEWLSTRVMLLQLLGEGKIIHNRKDGSPYIADSKQLISISHTREYAAILLHEHAPVGIDIETRTERVSRIADKFISEKEYIDPTRSTLHQLLHWSAKESLYKLIGMQGIDFKKHLQIHPFTPDTEGVMLATETRSATSHSYRIYYEVHPDYVLTWTTG
ncbi:MAG: 4'-phosphopantetheinyl transferase superfamily protein [Proteiniphilum sp.]|nr:4'-phosphopantetheinyl transferase superfamily protein [Proteiniphilum sp.]MDD4799543.1 4'-phosphopantetheinyl transferase superfamily protein [Proteiniphilum sp.]